LRTSARSSGRWDEGESDPVHAGRQNGIKVAAVLLRQRANRKFRVRQADALTVGNLGAGDHAAADEALPGLDGLELQAAVIDQKTVAGLNGGENLRVRKIDPRRVAGLRIVVQDEFLADFQRNLPVCEGAHAQFGSLKVGQDADGTLNAALDVADALHQSAHQVVVGVTHVDAEDIRAGLIQLLDHRLIGRGRPKRGDDLDLSATLH